MQLLIKLTVTSEGDNICESSSSLVLTETFITQGTGMSMNCHNYCHRQH